MNNKLLAILLLGALLSGIVLPIRFVDAANFSFEFGTLGSADGQFNFPVGVTVDSSGNIFVADQNNNRVQKFDSTGNHLLSFSAGLSPTDVALDGSGNIYVAANGAHRINKFDASGTFVGCLAGGVPGFQNPCSSSASGSADGQFLFDAGVDVDSAGNIYVASQNNNRLQKFDSSGIFLGCIGGLVSGFQNPCVDFSAGSADGQFANPFGVEVDDNGNIYVGDRSNQRVQVFDASGFFVRKFGSAGAGVGQFSDGPFMVDVDSSGIVYAVDRTGSKINVFSNSGTALAQFGTSGSGPGQFTTPFGFAVDANKNMYVGDTGNNRVQVFSPFFVEVLSVTPDQNGVGATPDASISIVFSDSLNAATVDQTSIPVYGDMSGLVPASYSLSTTNVTDDTVVIDPSQDFSPAEKITVVASNTVESLTGSPTLGFSSEFWVSGANALTGFEPQVNFATSGGTPVAMKMADFNHDAFLDLIAVLDSGTTDLFTGDGAGSFVRTSFAGPGQSTYDVAVGDLDRDGNMDYIRPYGAGIGVYLGNGDSTFQSVMTFSTTYQVESTALTDFNGDGALDVAVSMFNNGFPGNGGVAVFLGNGDGTFSSANEYLFASEGSPSVGVADLNNDGFMDLAAARYWSGELKVYLGNGDGTLMELAGLGLTGAGFQYLTLAPFDGDLFADLFHNDNANLVFRSGNGLGSFGGGSFLGSPRGSSWVGDIEGDGDLDVLTSDGDFSFIRLRQNDGFGSFTLTSIPVSQINLDAVAGDFNGDGNLDLVSAVAFQQRVSLFLASPPNAAPVVGFTVDHVIPAAQISQATDASGVLTVNFKVRDAESDTVTLTDFEYSTDQGVNWNAVSTGSAAFGGSWPDNGGPGFATSSAFGSTFSFTVDTQHADLLGFNAFDFSNARIRWKADDGTNVSVSPAESEPFVIDNVPAQTNDLSLVDNLGFQGRDDSLVSLDNGQTIYASYQNYDSGIPRLRFAKSTDAGATWTTSTVDNNADTGYYTSLTAVDADTIFISAGTVGSLTVYKSTDAGDTWTPIVVDTIPLAFYTSISAVDADTIFVSYITNLFGELRVARSTDGGDTWDIETVDPDPGPSATSLFAVDANTAYVSYLENDNTLNFAKSTDGGDTWMLVSANPAINSGLFSSLVATDANHIYMTWYDQGDGSLGFSKSTDAGDTWQHSQIAAQGGSSSLKAFDVDHLMVAFIENNVLSLAESIDAGDTWSVTLLDATYAPQLPSLALVSEEKQYISYNDSTANTLRIARLLPDITLESRPVSGSDPLVMVEFGERNPDTSDFQAERNNAGYGPVVPGQANTTAPAPQATSVGAFLDGDDVITKVKVSLVDDFGNASVLENTSLPVELATVLPLTPDVPDVRDITPTQVTVEVIPNAGELGEVEYSIRFVSTVTEYVQAGGALGGTPFFQTLSGWGGATGISVTGLTAGTSYTVSVDARNPNGDAVETTYSTGVNLSPASGGSRHRFVEEPSEVSAENLAAGSVGGAAPVLNGGAPHEAAGGEVLPQVLGSGLKILAQLNVLFSWMDPSDYELTSRSVRKLDQFKTILSMKKTLKVLAIVTGYSDGYAYRNPDREPIANAAELMKAIMISFSECYSDAQLERVLRHDYAENGWWWAGYWYFLDPLMQRFLGHDYVLWSSIKDVNILELLQVFLTDYCGGAEDRV